MAKTQLVEIHPPGTHQMLVEMIEYIFELGEETEYLENRVHKNLFTRLKLYGPKIASNRIIDYKCVDSFYLL